jgi:hypothetical protein
MRHGTFESNSVIGSSTTKLSRLSSFNALSSMMPPNGNELTVVLYIAMPLMPSKPRGHCLVQPSHTHITFYYHCSIGLVHIQIILSVEGDASVGSETFFITNFINLKIKPTQCFGGAHRGRMYMHAFVGVGAHMCMSICVYTVFLIKKMNMSGEEECSGGNCEVP